MRIGFKATNDVDDKGRPCGGSVDGTGFSIKWQNGPLGRRGTNERIGPNGAFVEDVLDAVRQRLDHYQAAGFECEENADAITYIGLALLKLDARTQRRVSAGVEGTHEGK